MCLTWPAKYIAFSAAHLFQLPAFSMGTVKVQFAKHSLVGGVTMVVAFQLMSDGKVVDVTSRLLVEALAVLATEKEVGEACGCAGAFAVIDADMKLAGVLIAFGHDQPAATW
jgi:hypothetical protein